MRTFVKRVVRILAFLWSKIYDPESSSFFRRAGYRFYSFWMQTAFGKVGDGFSVRNPLYVRGGKNITIGKNFVSLSGLRIETFDRDGDVICNQKLIIGDNVSFNNDCHIGCVERVIIGDNVLIASRVFITDHFHGRVADRDELLVAPIKRQLTTKGPVIIEADVWLGEGVVIMPGVIIGRGAVVGANSVVTHDVPPYAVAAGIPARIIKQL